MKKVLAIIGVIAICAFVFVGWYFFVTKDDQGFVDNHPGAVWQPIEDYTMVVEETSIEYIVGADGQSESRVQNVTRYEAFTRVNIDNNNDSTGNHNNSGNSVSTEPSNENKVDEGNISSTTPSNPSTENKNPTTQEQVVQVNPTYRDIQYTEAQNVTTRKGYISVVVSSHSGSYNGFNYTVSVMNDGRGDVTITGYDPSYGTAVTIPQTIENSNYKVKYIGDYAFANKGLTAITIPSTVAYIDSFAFAGNCHDGNLCVNIPSTVLNIGEGAFAGINVTSAPSNYILDKGCLYKGDTIISASSALETYTLRTGTRHIATGAFYGCARLKSITGMEMLCDDGRNYGINEYAFYGCTSLGSSLTLPSGINYLPEGSFAGCTSLESVIMRYASKSVLADREQLYNGGAFTGTILYAADGTTRIN